MFRIFRIRGDSMVPTLNAGDYVLAATWLRRPRVRQLVVVDHPVFGIVVKRLARKDTDGYWLASENSCGVSSSEMGAVAGNHIIGRVLFTIRRPVAREKTVRFFTINIFFDHGIYL